MDCIETHQTRFYINCNCFVVAFFNPSMYTPLWFNFEQPLNHFPRNKDIAMILIGSSSKTCQTPTPL